MRLSTIPSLPISLVAALEQCAIKTETDLLFTYTPTEVFQRLPPETISLHDLRKWITFVAQSVAAPGVRGDELLLKVRAREEVSWFCGLPALDGLLGGFGGPRVLEISGDRGAGKTTLARHVVLRHLAAHPYSSALWIDTTGEFSLEKVFSIVHCYEGKAQSTVLERLQVSLAFDIEASHDVLETLGATLNSYTASEAVIRCVVIDSITALISPLLSAASAQGHTTMTMFMRQLRALAHAHSLTFLVINNATNATPHNHQSLFSDTMKKPALGPSFTFLTDATLWLARAPETEAEDGATKHVAEVFRSKTTASRTWCSFKIRHGSIC